MSTADQNWLDGPGLVAFLEEVVGPDFAEGNASLTRRVYEWRRGGGASVFAVDGYLPSLGLHLTQVPDELYRDEPRGRKAA